MLEAIAAKAAETKKFVLIEKKRYQKFIKL